MEITFLRKGHSNNSSSSHSLIFTRGDLPESNESTEFGWQYFTCSSKGDKQNYLLLSIKSQLGDILKFPNLYTINNYNDKSWSEFIREQKESLSGIKDKIILEWVGRYLDIRVNTIDGYVDHQSEIRFPFDRTGENIHIEFAKDFINEFVNGSELGNWYVFGGNDNGGDEILPDKPTPNESNTNEKTSQYAELWRYLTDSGDHLCVKDEFTGEYVLSNTGGDRYNGAIMKVKF